MARKSRKDICLTPVAETCEKTYKTAIYARLSVEDAGKYGNGTIENQILLVQKYVESKPYLNLCEAYIDNGETGTNFERDGFLTLMEDIRRGKIDCIVVKDLSRFGRNYIEAGNYLERVFPFLGVRFISVNDGYDSHNPAKNSDSLTIVLKNLVNDIYVKDISKKIRTAFETKRKKGEFIGSFAPYGYTKSPADGHKLVIDEEAALIVRDVFHWKSSGLSSIAIASKLNETGVPSPKNYWYDKGILSSSRYAKKILWDDSYIRHMLANSAYIGQLEQGKRRSEIAKGVKWELQPKEKWIITENAHEPIVDVVTFEAVQKILADDKKKHYMQRKKNADVETTENIFGGLIYCTNCGRHLRRKQQIIKNKIYYNFACPSYSINVSSECVRKNISEKNLKKIVFAEIKQQIVSSSDTTEMKNEEKKINVSDKINNAGYELKIEIQILQQRLIRLNILKNSIYDEYKDGLLNQIEYKYARQKYDVECNQLTSRLNEISTELQRYADSRIKNIKYSEEMQRFSNADELTKDMLTVFVEKISVDSNRCIEIKYISR